LDWSTAYIRRVRRTRLSRGLASIVSVWLAICLAEPTQLHTCVMHGGLAIDVSAGAAVHGGSHGGIASTHAMAGHSHHDQGTDGQSKQCTCIGDCSMGRAPIGLAPAPIQLTLLEVEVPGAVFSYPSPSLVSPQYLLPFSNGPPSLSSRA
jgi:hypothetical protein